MPTKPRTVGDVFRMFFPGHPGCIGSDNGTACPVRMGLVAAGLLAPMESNGADAPIIPIADGPVVVEKGVREAMCDIVYGLNVDADNCDDIVVRILTALFPAGIVVADETVVLGKASDDFDEFGNYGGLRPRDIIYIKRREENE